MPSKSTRTKSGTKHVVRLKSVTVKVHNDDGEKMGDHTYYGRTKHSGSWNDKLNLPCLTYMQPSEKLTIDAEVAIISCGESFRFGIWEDDIDGGSLTGWDPLDDPMGDRWFTSLDFLVSSTTSLESENIKFELECESCHASCSKENSLAKTITKSSDQTYSMTLSEEVKELGFGSKDSYLPVGLWNYDSAAKKATKEYKLTEAGMTMNCKDCHLTVSDADLYVELTLDAFSGYKGFSVLADAEVTFHVDAILTGSKNKKLNSIKALVDDFALPSPLSISATVVGIGFTVGLKAKVDLLTDMSTAVDGSATYTSDVVGKLKAGLIYDMDTGINFLSTSDISNENVGWENSIIGELSSRLTVRPCLQAGVWAKASSFANAHAYGEICAGVFAETTLKHDSRGYETPLGPESNMSKALVKLDEVFPSTFKSCDASSKHDTRLLVQVGVSNVKLGADLNAELDWGFSSSSNEPANKELRKNAYGPWPLIEEMSTPVASGCLCISACGRPALPSAGAPALPPAPTSTDVDMPNDGSFVEGIISLVGMQLYEWNSAAELAFRKTIASSANVWVNHVRIDSVTARQINRRRSLLSTSALDVEYVVYAASPEQAGTIASSISADAESGALAIKARENGLTAVTSTSSVKEPTTTTKTSSSTQSISGYSGRALYSLLSFIVLAFLV